MTKDGKSRERAQTIQFWSPSLNQGLRGLHSTEDSFSANQPLHSFLKFNLIFKMEVFTILC